MSRRILLLLVFFSALGFAQDLADFEKRVTEFDLPNGLHVIVAERHEVPVVSFVTYANVGSVDDPKGETGLAHMFEHMAFKGTDQIGTKNWPDEKRAIEAEDRAYMALHQERLKGPRADPQKIQQLTAVFKQAEAKAESYVIPNEYPRLIESNGGVGMNAYTSMDATVYFYSLPSNRAELWFSLESERFLNPVFREFYKERDVVREERRMRIESDPQGKLVETMLGAAYEAHPYKNSGVGWPSDVENLTIEEARQFYRDHYAPVNLTLAIVGDVTGAQVRQWAEKYFARLGKGPAGAPVITAEPSQSGERRVQVVSPTQPILLLAYHKPSQQDHDRAVFDVINSVLSSGRTSWLYRSLVRDKKIALFAGGFPDFPGTKYPGLFVFLDYPAPHHSVEENERAIEEQLTRLKTQRVDAATLNMVKTKTRAELIRELDSNGGLAQELAFYHTNYGDWRQLFRHIDEVNAVTAEDVQRVARAYFQPQLRNAAYLAAPPGGAPPGSTPSPAAGPGGGGAR